MRNGTSTIANCTIKKDFIKKKYRIQSFFLLIIIMRFELENIFFFQNHLVQYRTLHKEFFYKPIFLRIFFFKFFY